ncbi:YoaK family protein [Holzapfeliella floricola]|uniref:YoaK family protein n=1 Tax=Holzapfeliella floricola TaxID=679249 RepID=UPI000780E67E|nr:YoaK family protein [Holzapfeliella floricola]
MLSIVGGFVDAFSYLHLGHVFSALQTGNIVLLGLNIATFNVGAILHYLLPIFSFLVASAIANFVELSGPKLNRFVWQEIVIYIELIGLFITRLLISQLDTTIIVSMLSFFYGISGSLISSCK